jgi:hypothetical protein
VKLSYELIDEVQLNLIVMKKNWSGDCGNDENEECVDPVVVLIAEKRDFKLKSIAKNMNLNSHWIRQQLYE